MFATLVDQGVLKGFLHNTRTATKAGAESTGNASRGGYRTVPGVSPSNLFFSPLVYRTRIKAPVDFALGIVRSLEGRVGTSALAVALEELGQNVFFPPSVKALVPLKYH